MTDEKNQTTETSEEPIIAVESVEDIISSPAIAEEVKIPAAIKSTIPEKGKGGRKTFGFRKGGVRLDKKDEFDQRILDIARVTRVMAGGKRMRFRACVAIGDKKGKIGIGVGKGADVTLAVNKAVNRAKKEIVEVPIVNDTIPHEIHHKYCAAKILFKPAKKGKGVIAGGVVRVILELAGVKNITSKVLGSGNKISNARCTLEAMKKLRKVENVVKKVIEDKKIETN